MRILRAVIFTMLILGCVAMYSHFYQKEIVRQAQQELEAGSDE